MTRPSGRAPRGLGAPPYLAPEHARDDTLSQRLDVWGLGAVRREAAPGRPPVMWLERGA